MQCVHTWWACLACIQPLHIGVSTIVARHREVTGQTARAVVAKGTNSARPHHAVVIATDVEGHALVVEAWVRSVHARQTPVTRGAVT
jgi:hypothetical protein